MLELKNVLQDEDYFGLPDVEKAKVINYTLQQDPDFNGLPPEEQAKVKQYFIKKIAGEPPLITQKLAEWKYSGIGGTPEYNMPMPPVAKAQEQALKQGKYYSIIKPEAPSTTPTTPEKTLPPEVPELRVAPPESKARLIGRKIGMGLGLVPTPEERLGTSQTIYNVSQQTGLPIEEVEKKLPQITKALEIRGIPTTTEYISAMMSLPIFAGLATHPLGLVKGLAEFTALSEVENYITSKIKEEPYKAFQQKGLKELLPEETTELTKDITDILDFIGKGLIVGGISRAEPKIAEKLTKTYVEKYKLPKKVYIPANKVASIFRTGEEISPEELSLIKSAGLTGDQYATAVRKGIEIEVPAEKIVMMVDKPYWAKLKSIINIKPSAPVIRTFPAGEITGKTPIGELPGETTKMPVYTPIERPPIPEAPAPPTPPEVKAEPILPTPEVKPTPEIPPTKPEVVPEAPGQKTPSMLTEEELLKMDKIRPKPSGIGQGRFWEYRDKKGIFTVAPSKEEAIKRANDVLIEGKPSIKPKEKPIIITKKTTPKEIEEKVKRKITIFSDKEGIIRQLVEAYEKAPEEGKEGDRVYIKVDGDWYINNDKETIKNVLGKVKKTAQYISTTKPAVQGRAVSGAYSSNYEYLDELMKPEKEGEYFTDEHILVKGIPPNKAKYGNREFSVEDVDNILKEHTKPAKLLHYYSDAPELQAVSNKPIAGLSQKEAREDRGKAVFEDTDGNKYFYNQFRLNVIRRRYPDAKYGVANNGMLIAYKDNKPVGALASIPKDKIDFGQYERIISQPPEAPQPKVPSGYGFPKITTKKTMGERPEFKPTVEMPEMVKLAKDLSGKTPIIKNLRTSYGIFTSPTGQIKLDPEIFKDEILSGQVLAHEIGHLIDWLPNYILTRGNIIGRLLTLQGYLKNTFGNLDNKEIRQELKNLTQYWHPFDENENDNFTKYRYKSSELYAEAISVLLNQPEKLKEIAPKFYEAFRKNLYNKPEVEQALTDLRNFISSGEKNIIEKREESILKMFREGEELYSNSRKAKQKSKQLKWVDNLKREIIDKNMAVIKMVEKDIKMGKKVNPENDPKYYLEEYNYLSGKVKNVLYDVDQQVVEPVLDAGMTTEDLGQYLFLNRVITERSDIANPLGFNRSTAQKQLDYLLNKLGRDKEVILKKAIDNFKKIQENVLERAVEGGLIKPETYSDIATNTNYATFQVLDYLDEYVSPAIIQQKGTLKEIANPLDASVLKLISTIRAVERNKLRNVVVDYLEELHPKDIEEAEPIRFGKYKTEFKERNDRGLIVLRENGTLKGYYVDPYIADTVMYSPSGTSSALINALRWANRSYFKPIYVNLNLGFQSYNLIRDLLRAWKLTPDVPLWKMIGTYFRALPKAKQRVMGDFSDPVIREMQENGMFGFTFNQMFGTDEENVDEITRLFRMYQIQKETPTKNPFKIITDRIEVLGDIIESIPKISGYMIRKEAQPTRPIKEIAHEVRVYAGSPDFLRVGAGYYYYNNLLMFSNAIKEGIRGDFEGMFRDPRTRSGYWAKTFMVNVLPKIVMFLGTIGLLGKDIKDQLDGVSEYNKTNYTIIPLSKLDNGETLFVRIPQDEVGRMIGGMVWKMLNSGEELKTKELAPREIPEAISQIVTPFGQQLPSISPSLELTVNTAMFLLGQNPYDFFRGKTILSQDEMQAGGLYKLEPFLGWIGDEMGLYGLRISVRTSMNEPPIVRFMNFTPVVGRYIKTSDYGLKEQEREAKKPISKQRAIQRIKRKKIKQQLGIW